MECAALHGLMYLLGGFVAGASTMAIVHKVRHHNREK
jgi:hypothetical protein